MKLISLSILLISIQFSQGLSFLKSNISTNYGFQSAHIAQSLENLTGNFAAGLSNANAGMGFHFSFASMDATNSTMRLNAGLSYELSESHHFSFNVRMKSMSDYIVKSKLNTDIRLGTLSDQAFTVGYAYVLNENMSVGANAGYLRSAIIPIEHQYNGETIRVVSSVNLGLSGLYTFNHESQTALSFSFENLGAEKSYSIDTPPIDMPTYFRAGVSSIVYRADSYYIYGNGNYAQDNNSGSRFDIGVGLQLKDHFDFHVNYVSDNEFVLNDSYVSMGVGYGQKSYKINLNYESYDDSKTNFATASQISLSLDYYFERSEETYEPIEEYVEVEEVEEKKDTVVVAKVKPVEKDTVLIAEVIEPVIDEPVVEPVIEEPTMSPELQKLVEKMVTRNKEGIVLKSYIVKEGDSFWRLSEKNLGDGNKLNEIVEVNVGRYDDRDLIYVGQELIIVSKVYGDKSQIDEVYYEVKNGETLETIADKLYSDKSKWSDIVSWNKILEGKTAKDQLKSVIVRVLVK